LTLEIRPCDTALTGSLIIDSMNSAMLWLIEAVILV